MQANGGPQVLHYFDPVIEDMESWILTTENTQERYVILADST